MYKYLAKKERRSERRLFHVIAQKQRGCVVGSLWLLSKQ